MSSNILSINEEIFNYLNDVNYGMTKSQFQYLTNITNGLINLSGTKSLLKISENVVTAKSSSSIYRFLSHSKWDDRLIDRNRINYLNLHFYKLIKPQSVGFLAIDDTISYIRSLTGKNIVLFLYNQAKSNVPVKTVLHKLKLVS
ncbi:hypothetical protein AXF41_12195 [Clostridium haemolyticum]|uniref:transposase n=1 Tax=Clostridium haemolyticum TaxID=84025 RepID=UPI0009CAEA7E|nr:transposase [Clostridium haemolyticum]OOB76437.1 hypothetical protein AXF41_12195 [Clostridium haemolyticum]